MPTSKRYKQITPTTNRILYFAPAVIWGFFIVYFSLMPGNEVPEVLTEINDKLVHATIYFTSAGLIYLGFIRYNFSNAITSLALWSNIAICILGGAVIEVLQYFWVANRNGDWQDFLANALGSLMSVLLFRLLHGLRA
jgi:hypothetical protein